MSSFFDSASLVQIPSGIKDGVLYSVKPIDGSGDLTFSRGSDIEATRVNANGYIQKAQVNLLLQSQTFENASWSVTNATKTANTAVAPDGTTTADTFSVTAAFGIIYQAPTISSGSVCTYSVYVKNIDAAVFTLQVRTTTTAGLASFNFTGGTLTSSSLTSGITQGYTDEGNGWYRVFVTFVTSEVNQLCRFQIQDSGDSVYLWGAQLNYGLVAQTYQETTTAAVVSGITDNMPRLNYDPANPTCPSLLLEGSRTNIHTNSEYLDAYVKSRATITTNASTSPEGVTNASKIIPLSTSTGWAGVNAPNYSFTSGQTYSLSVFCKAGEYNYAQVGGSTPAFPASFATINLTNGVVEHQSGISATTEDYGNGWWRISFTHTAIVTATSPIGFLAVYSTAVSSRLATQVGDDVSGIFAYGWQAELGSYPSSLIPCYGSSATRNADGGAILQNMRTNGITTTGAFTAFFDISPEQLDAASNDNSVFFNTWVNNLSSGIVSARKYYVSNPEGNIRWFSDADGGTMGYSDTTNKKWAVVCNGTSVKVFTDGALVINYTGTNSHNSLGSMQLGYGSSNRTSTSFSQCLVFPTALSDADCITLTA